MEIERLCKVLAQGPREVHGSSIGTSNDIATLVQLGVLKPAGTIRSLVCSRCEEQHFADVVSTDERVGWYCPADGFVVATPDEIAAYAITLAPFLDLLSGQTDGKRRWARPKGAPILWSLGSHVFHGDLRIAVYYAHNAANTATLNSVLTILKTVERPDALAVLTSDTSDLSEVKLPYVGRIVALTDCVHISENGNLTLDLDWLARRVLPPEKLEPPKPGRPRSKRKLADDAIETLVAKEQFPEGRNAQLKAVMDNLKEQDNIVGKTTAGDAVDAWRKNTAPPEAA